MPGKYALFAKDVDDVVYVKKKKKKKKKKNTTLFYALCVRGCVASQVESDPPGAPTGLKKGMAVVECECPPGLEQFAGLNQCSR